MRYASRSLCNKGSASITIRRSVAECPRGNTALQIVPSKGTTRENRHIAMRDRAQINAEDCFIPKQKRMHLSNICVD